ncbi:hypothetical protein BJI67_14000 [Acidihalobacter aeolianus]|uniref:Uncharacterized protein n=1 Tax=Acidihalobacter aeolianus TaxID=2792603 RepID=A0A1D8KAR7_9GAMM|nr:DUF6231 family protein [Acidihalobacter aeolianus]AOV18026.1 hypothetical protein BJI67_14000 [Acidihalobacter aeolianus]
MTDPLDDLERLALSAPSGATLLIAPAGHPLAERLQVHDGSTAQTAQSLLSNPPQRRYALALLADGLDDLSSDDGRRLIAGLRDLYAETLYCLASSERWPTPSMLALGLRPLASYPSSLALYHFDLYDYKRTPDWLNSRHWANPERWDKARW